MDDDDDYECPDVWHLGYVGDDDQWCPTCGCCEVCGASCDCLMI